MKKSNAILGISRFIIIALAIIIQAVIWWVIYFKLNKEYFWLQILSSIIGVVLFFAIVNKDQPAVYKIPWVILFTIFPLGGVVVYFTFGNLKLNKKTVKRINSVFKNNANETLKSNTALTSLKNKNALIYGQAKYLSSACNTLVYSDSLVEYISSGEEYFNLLKTELKKATRYIFFEYFIIEEGKVWSEIYDILKEKASNGVNVYLMYDDVGSMPRLNKNFHKKLNKIGIKAVKFNPFRPIVSVIHNNRDHRKITVIDGVVAFTGGINIADEYANIKTPFGKWKDAGVIIKGNAVAGFVKTFCQLYNLASKQNLNVNDFLVFDIVTYNNEGYIVPFFDGPSPVSPERVAETAYLNVINQATKYLYITSPYLVVDTNIIDALINASRRGVDVKIILPQIPDKKIVSVMTRSNYEKLIAGGVKVYEYKGGFVHSKIFVSDDVCIIGTVNLDYRSLVHHFENAVLVSLSKVVLDVKTDFENIIKTNAILISKETAKQNPILKILKGILNIFSPLF